MDSFAMRASTLLLSVAMNRLAHVAAIGLCIALLLVAGCGAPAKPAADPDVTHMRALGILYGRFMANNGGAKPANQEAFAKYIEQEPANWNKLAPTSADFLTKGHEGQALTVRYGKDAQASPEDGRLWVAYETEPHDGKQLAVDAEGAAQLIDHQQFTKLFP